MMGVIQLRLIVPVALAQEVYEGLRTRSGVAHLIAVPTRATVPAGEVFLCDVAGRRPMM